jgi:hypothetical protein
MKFVQVIMSGALILGLSAVGSADQLPANDPQIKTGGPLGASSFSALALPASAPAGIITSSFTIKSPSGTSPGTSPCALIQGGVTSVSPQCYFENDIQTAGVGDTITELKFDALGISPSTVLCQDLSGSPFSACMVRAITGGTEVDFTGGSIPFHNDFTLQFDGFPANFSSQATATITPEPGTMALLLAGLGSLAIRRRRS